MRAAPRQPQRPAPRKAFNPRTTPADAATLHRSYAEGYYCRHIAGRCRAHLLLLKLAREVVCRAGCDRGDRLVVLERFVLDQIAELDSQRHNLSRDVHADLENLAPVLLVELWVRKLEQHRLVVAQPRLDRVLVPHSDLVMVRLHHLGCIRPVRFDLRHHLLAEPIMRVVAILKAWRIADYYRDSRVIPRNVNTTTRGAA